MNCFSNKLHASVFIECQCEIGHCTQFVFPNILSGYNPSRAVLLLLLMLWCGGRCRVVEHMTRMTTTEKALLFNCRGLVMSPEYKGVYGGHNGETGLNTGIWRKDNDS